MVRVNAARTWPRSVGVDEVPRRLQCLRLLQRPAGVVITLRGRQQPGGVAVQEAAAVQCVRLSVRDLRFGGQRGGVAREGLRGVQVAGLGGEADGIGHQVLDLPEVF